MFVLLLSVQSLHRGLGQARRDQWERGLESVSGREEEGKVVGSRPGLWQPAMASCLSAAAPIDVQQHTAHLCAGILHVELVTVRVWTVGVTRRFWGFLRFLFSRVRNGSKVFPHRCLRRQHHLAAFSRAQAVAATRRML